MLKYEKYAVDSYSARVYPVVAAQPRFRFTKSRDQISELKEKSSPHGVEQRAVIF